MSEAELTIGFEFEDAEIQKIIDALSSAITEGDINVTGVVTAEEIKSMIDDLVIEIDDMNEEEKTVDINGESLTQILQGMMNIVETMKLDESVL